MTWLDAAGGERLAWWGHNCQAFSLAAAWYAVGDTRAGEDGSPCVRVREDGLEGLIGVFDGLGGAGTQPMWQLTQEEKPLSGACVASHVASVAALNWHASGDASVDGLQRRIVTALQEADAATNVPKPRFSGSALRRLPTTIAAISFHVAGESVVVRPLWLGDSRCYVMDESRGLRQISKDDTRGEPDALGALRAAAPMTSTIGLDRPFTIHEGTIAVGSPVVLVVATDGCTDYVVAPHQLELRLLTALSDASSAERWAELIAQRVTATAGDDATLIAFAYGYGGFEHLKQRFQTRLSTIQTLEDKTVGRSDPAEPAATEQAADIAWSMYRTWYESDLEHVVIAP